MKAGFFYSGKRERVYYRLKRQIVLDFRLELEQATGLKRDWIRWKRGLALESRYNQLLFSGKQPQRLLAQPLFMQQRTAQLKDQLDASE